MKKYEVIRQHYGDKQYYSGDTRELDDERARELLALGVIRLKAEKPEETNVEEPADNKAEEPAEKPAEEPAENKAETAPKNKARK